MTRTHMYGQQEMEGQMADLRKELQARSVREQDANDTIKMQAQALMKEKQQLEVCVVSACQTDRQTDR